MPLETGTYISDLVSSNPAHTDTLSQADSHIRLIKAALLSTFPNINGAVSITDEALNRMVTQGFVSPVDGTGSVPAFSFISEPSLGLYRQKLGYIKFAGIVRGNGLIPPGMIAPFAMATAPDGWIPCDGYSISTTTYADLFAAIGYTWGGSGGNFNVPNLLARYLRHRDNSIVSGAVGVTQTDSVVSHGHNVGVVIKPDNSNHRHSGSGTTQGANHNHTHNTTFRVQPVSVSSADINALVVSGGTGATSIASGGQSDDHGHDFSVLTADGEGYHVHDVTVTQSNFGGVETRPLSASVMYCIKT